MSIFEDLENLNVSEECFNNIVDIVEEYINELKKEDIDKVVGDAYDEHADEIENLKKKTKAHHPDDVDTAFNNYEIEGEIGDKEETFKERMDRFQKHYDEWLDWKRKQEKKKEEEEEQEKKKENN